MATAVSLRTVFTSSTSGLVSGANTAGNAMKKVQKDMAGMRGSLATLKTIAIGQVFAQLSGAAISAGRSLIGFGQSTAEGIDVISKLSRRLGLTYGQLSGLKMAGDLAGVGLETIAMGATKLDVAFVAASAGGKEAGAAIAKFTSLGLSMKELEQMSPDERFAAIADAIARLPTAAQRSAAAIRLFGKSGAELLPLFEEGAGAIKKATDMAEKFGTTLNNAQGAGVEKMNDSFTTAFAAIQGLATQVVSNLAEPISRIIDDFTNFVAASGGVDIGASISNAMLDGAIFVVEMFGVAADVMYKNFIEPFGSASGALIAAFDKGAGVANVFLGIGNFLIGAFQKIAANFAAVFSIFLSGASGVASLLGFKENADSLAAMASSMSDSSKSLVADAGKSMKAAGENFAAAVDGAASKKIAGAPIKIIREGRDAAAAAPNMPVAAAAKVEPAALRMKADAELPAKQKTAAEKVVNEKAKDTKDDPLKTFHDSLSALRDALFNEAISQEDFNKRFSNIQDELLSKQKTAAEKIGSVEDNPLKTFRESLSTLQQSLASGAISQEDFNKRFSNIQDELVAANQDALDAQAGQAVVSQKPVSAVDATNTARQVPEAAFSLSADQSANLADAFKASGEAFRESVGLGADEAVKQAGNGVADRIIKQIKEGRAAAEDNRKKPDNAAAKINPEVKRQKDQAELQRKQKTAAEKIGNEKDNPLKTFRDSLSTLQDALFNEAISQEEFNRRFSVIQDDLIAANQDAIDAEAEQVGVSRKMIGAVDATSTAGIAEKFRLMNPDTPGLKEQRQVAADTKRLRELAQAAADGVPVPVQLLPKGA